MTRQINIFTWLFSFIKFMHLGVDDGSGAGGDGGDGGSSDGGQGDSGAGDSGGDGGDGGQGADWLAGVSDELKGHSSMEPIKDLPGLVDSFVNAQSMIGKSIRIPGEDASNEAKAEFMAKLLGVPGVYQMPDEEDKDGMTAFYRKLGAPEKPEDYKIDRPDLPEGYKYDDDLQTAVLKTAQEHGVSQKAMEAIFGTYWDNFATTVEGRVEAAKETIAALKTEWGAGYSQRMGLARSIITQFGGEVLSKELDEGTLGNNPELAKLFATIGQQFSEDGIIKVDSQIADTRSELEAKIGEMQANLAGPYHVKSHPGHAAAVKRMDAWNEQLAQYK